MGPEFDPDLAPGDAEVGVVPGGFAEEADGVDEHQGRRPAVGEVFAADPAVFEVPAGEPRPR